jgi:hypothetical protein
MHPNGVALVNVALMGVVVMGVPVVEMSLKV